MTQITVRLYMKQVQNRRVSEEPLRHLQCWHCSHCMASNARKSQCELTGRWGNTERAFFCLDFGNKRAVSNTTEFHGYKVKNRQTEDWRTENQWQEMGYQIKPGEKPTKMWKNAIVAEHNIQRGGLFEYYLPEQTIKIL